MMELAWMWMRLDGTGPDSLLSLARTCIQVVLRFGKHDVMWRCNWYAIGLSDSLGGLNHVLKVTQKDPTILN